MRSRRILELAVGIVVALTAGSCAANVTGPHDLPDRPPWFTTAPGSDAGSCQEGHR